jgi:hypothetical protein
MALLNPVIALFQDLPMKDRRALVELINQCAHEETDPERHLTAWETPEALGLLPCRALTPGQCSSLVTDILQEGLDGFIHIRLEGLLLAPQRRCRV